MNENANILPADYAGQRIADLRTAHKMSKEELAKLVDISPSMQGRIESGETKSIKDELLKKYAKIFDVSVDFLLGLTDFPGKKNYEIGELGLSIKSAEVLYTRKVDTDVVNRLLEEKSFPLLTKYIQSYFQGEISDGVKSRHEIIKQLNKMSKGYIPPEDREDIITEYTIGGIDPTEMDKARIQNLFMTILMRIRNGISKQVPTSAPASVDLVQAMFQSVIPGGAAFDIKQIAETATPETLASAVLPFLSFGIPLNEEQQAKIEELTMSMLQIIKEAYDGIKEKDE